MSMKKEYRVKKMKRNILQMQLGTDSYDIIIKRDALTYNNEYFQLNRKVLIITDEHVPIEYATKIANQCLRPYIEIVKAGEQSKSFKTVEKILKDMLSYKFTREDCVVAVGGGVVGDLSGFIASLYMRGIDFYNVPTTILSQVDSSIGGKVAVNFEGIKNIVGTFYQPKSVLIDPTTLNTLPARQITNGLIEAIKIGAIMDSNLFKLFEKKDYLSELDWIIERSLSIKKYIVEQDERENGIRKILNFGHTIGHGIETAGEGRLLHGESVALGMLYMANECTKIRLLNVYRNIGLIRELADIGIEINENGIDVSWLDNYKIKEAIVHDKKSSGNDCSIILVNEIGTYEIATQSMQQLLDMI